MNLVFLGPPSAGKGTQAMRVAEKLGLVHIATGDLLRAAIAEGTELGLQAKKHMDAGGLVPDDIVVGIVGEYIRTHSVDCGALFDGFPRTTAQADALGAMLAEMGREIDRVIYFHVPDELLIPRATSRRVCRQCNASFHLRFIPPRQEGVCDHCNGELYQREDDKEETVKARLETYHRETASLLPYYKEQRVLMELTADAPVDEITETILHMVGGVEA